MAKARPAKACTKKPAGGGAKLLTQAASSNPTVATAAFKALVKARRELGEQELSKAADILCAACRDPAKPTRIGALNALKALGPHLPPAKRKPVVESLMALGEGKRDAARYAVPRSWAVIAAIAPLMTREEEREIIDHIVSPLDENKVHDAAQGFSDEGAGYLGFALLRQEAATKGKLSKRYGDMFAINNRQWPQDVLRARLERLFAAIDAMDPSRKYNLFPEGQELDLYGLYLDLQYLHLWLDEPGRERLMARLEAARAATTGEVSARFGRMIVEAQDEVRNVAKGWGGLIVEGRRTFGAPGPRP